MRREYRKVVTWGGAAFCVIGLLNVMCAGGPTSGDRLWTSLDKAMVLGVVEPGSDNAA